MEGSKRRFRIGNERGAALAMVAVSIAALLGAMALAIDLGFLFKARGEAQRAADAAALAGASAFLEEEGAPAVPIAEARAYDLALRNYMTGGLIDSSEVIVQVIPDSSKVRVYVRRANIPTWFARFLGFTSVPVGAKGTAEAQLAGTAKCVKPFLMPDYWNERSGQDKNLNRLWDLPAPQGNRQQRCSDVGVECWNYEPAATPLADRYKRFGEDNDTASWTGLGSPFRNLSPAPGNLARYEGDYGRPIMLYPNSPQGSPTPSNFYLWQLTCPGGDCIRDAIAGCVTPDVSVGDTLAVESPGAKKGPVIQGLEDWWAEDPTAEYVTYIDAQGYTRGEVVSANPSLNGLANPRVFAAALFSPDFLAPGKQTVTINNLALFFLESKPPNQGSKQPIVARFLGYASGFADGPVFGTLIKQLRLVE